MREYNKYSKKDKGAYNNCAYCCFSSFIHLLLLIIKKMTAIIIPTNVPQVITINPNNTDIINPKTPKIIAISAFHNPINARVIIINALSHNPSLPKLSFAE